QLYDDAHGTDRYHRLLDCSTWWRNHFDPDADACFSTTCRCGLKHCLLCSEARARFLFHQVRAWLLSIKQASFLTLTIASSDLPLIDQVANMTNAFRRLRHAKFFRTKCRGGIWLIQVTFNADRNQFHLHLHATIDSAYIPQDLISTRWSKLTGGSFRVDIRRIKGRSGAARDLARYATRAGWLSNFPEDRLLEYAEAFESKHMCGTWGNARGISLVPAPQRDMTRCIELPSDEQLCGMAPDSFAAQAVILALATGCKINRWVIDQLRPQAEPATPDFMKDRAGNVYDRQSLFARGPPGDTNVQVA
ncbi:unnamed protein product, partial [marine sediment metagenome]